MAKAHTGSLVGDDAVVDAVFRQHGVIRVDSVEDLVITSGLLAATGPLPGRRFGFVTPSGGACEIIADRAEDEGIEIPEFAPETVIPILPSVPRGRPVARDKSRHVSPPSVDFQMPLPGPPLSRL